MSSRPWQNFSVPARYRKIERREHISCANVGIHGSGMEFLLSRASTLARDSLTKQTETTVAA
jgi:hypothetical protein